MLRDKAVNPWILTAYKKRVLLPAVVTLKQNPKANGMAQLLRLALFLRTKLEIDYFDANIWVKN